MGRAPDDAHTAGRAHRGVRGVPGRALARPAWILPPVATAATAYLCLYLTNKWKGAGYVMPRKTRRQLIGKQEDIERQEREDALLALEHELHRPRIESIDN